MVRSRGNLHQQLRRTGNKKLKNFKQHFASNGILACASCASCCTILQSLLRSVSPQGVDLSRLLGRKPTGGRDAELRDQRDQGDQR